MCALFFPVVKKGSLFTVRDASKLLDATVADIKEYLKIENDIICLQTEQIIKPLNLQEKVFKEHPTLVSETRPTSRFGLKDFICLMPLDFAESIAVAFIIKTQEDYDIPNFFVNFSKKEIDSLTVDNLTELVSKTVDIEHENGVLTFKGVPLNNKLKGQKLLEYITTNFITYECTLSEKAITRIGHRTKILTEIITTETSYINDLNMIINYFQPAIARMKLLSEADMNKIFREIPTILSTHAHFLFQLNRRGTKFGAEVSDCLIEFSNFFKVSMMYIGRFSSITEIAKKIKGEALEDLIKHCPSDAGGRDLMSYLITPVQRLPRYILFIKELVKFTPKMHPESAPLNVAFEKIDLLTREAEEQESKDDATSELFSIQQRVTPRVSILGPTRSLVEKFEAALLPALGRAIVYLFNDMLLITQPGKTTEQLVLHAPLNTLRFEPMKTELSVAFGQTAIAFDDASQKSDFICLLIAARERAFVRDTDSLIWREVIPKQPVPTAINASGATLGDDLYIMGGYVPLSAKQMAAMPFVAYNIKVGSIRSAQGLSLPIYGASIVEYGGALYLFGGCKVNSRDRLATVYRIEPGANEWSLLETGGEAPAVSHYASVVRRGVWYIFGGNVGHGQRSNDLYAFDFERREFSKVSTRGPKPEPRAHHAGVLCGDLMLVSGGHDEGGIFDDLWAFDFKSHEWTKINARPGMRSDHAMFVRGRNLFIIGGRTAGEGLVMQSDTVVDLVTGESGQIGSIGNSAKMAQFALVERCGEVYVFGGIDEQRHIRYALTKISLPSKYNSEEMMAPETISFEHLKLKVPEKEVAEESPKEKDVPKGRPRMGTGAPAPNLSELETIFARRKEANAHEEGMKPAAKPQRNFAKTMQPELAAAMRPVVQKELVKEVQKGAAKEAVKKPAKATAAPPKEKEGPKGPSSLYDAEVLEVLQEMNVDASGLAPFQARVVDRQIKKLISIRAENEVLKERISKAVIFVGGIGVSTVIVVDRKAKVTKMLGKVAFNTVAVEARGRKAIINVAGKFVPLDEQSFAAAGGFGTMVKVVLL